MTLFEVDSYETGSSQAIRYNSTNKKGAVFERLGAQKGRQQLIDNGVLGQYEDVGYDNVVEVAVYDTSIIHIVNKTPIQLTKTAP